jgi:hypothetical protein
MPYPLVHQHQLDGSVRYAIMETQAPRRVTMSTFLQRPSPKRTGYWYPKGGPGSREGLTITDPTLGIAYYFAVKTLLDEAGNTSAVSNVPSWTAGPP